MSLLKRVSLREYFWAEGMICGITEPRYASAALRSEKHGSCLRGPVTPLPPLSLSSTPPRTLGPVTLSWCGGPVDIGTPQTDRKRGVPEWTETSHWGLPPLASQLTETLPVPHPPCVHTGSQSGEQRGSGWVSPRLVSVCYFSRVGWEPIHMYLQLAAWRYAPCRMENNEPSLTVQPITLHTRDMDNTL